MRKLGMLAALVCAVLLTSDGARAQAASKAPTVSNGPASLEETLGAKEKAFFQAWKDGHPEVFQQNIVDGGIFFGEYGVTGKSGTVAEQTDSRCDVKGFKLTNFKVVSVTPHSAVLTYRAEQHGTCGGVAFNPYMNGLSVYVKRAGEWLNVVRSEVPAKDWGGE
jgi:Domain of unknown function (DUF4440)